MRDIGKNIRTIRTSRDMTQEDMAKALFVTRQTVSNYETGKSRPDIDMLFEIARVFDTDINTVIYGPALSENKKQAIRRAVISGAAVIVLAAAYVWLRSYFESLGVFRYSSVFYVLDITVRPASIFLLGWFIMHCIGVLGKIRPIRWKYVKTVKIILMVLAVLIAAAVLPNAVWWIAETVKNIGAASVNSVFPHIPIYTKASAAVIYAVLICPVSLAVLGAAFRFFDIPSQKEQRTDGIIC